MLKRYVHWIPIQLLESVDIARPSSQPSIDSVISWISELVAEWWMLKRYILWIPIQLVESVDNARPSSRPDLDTVISCLLYTSDAADE